MRANTPSSNSFLNRVRAEELPSRFEWHLRDTLSVLAIPAIFLAGWISTKISQDPAVTASTDTAVRIVVFVALVWVNASLLARHWRAFRRAIWRSIGVVIAGMILIQVIVSILGSLLGRGGTGAGAASGLEGDSQPHIALGVLIFVSLGPMVTALIEDFTFRHTLMLKLPVWASPLLASGVVIINALIFGAIHINNFNGNWLLTLSYAGAGLFMNLVYLWTRNVWHVLLMHGLNNFVLAGPVVVVLAAVLERAVG